jgi:ATP-dependent Clp protease ATP-binding subunit ClpA
MNERFSEHARLVIRLANQEALRLNHEYLGTEHILLGIIADGTGIAAKILADLGINLNRLRQEVEGIVEPGPDEIDKSIMLPITPRTRQVLDIAIAEAERSKHERVGTEHILFGLVHQDESVAAQVLVNLGLRAETICKVVLQHLGVSASCLGGVHERLQTPDRPAQVAEAIKGLQDVIEGLQHMRTEAIANQDYERCAWIRDRFDKLHKIMKVLLNVRHFESTSVEDVSADHTIL